MLDNPWVVIPLLIALYLTVYTFVKRVDGSARPKSIKNE